jgi:hypothetical protein
MNRKYRPLYNPLDQQQVQKTRQAARNEVSQPESNPPGTSRSDNTYIEDTTRSHSTDDARHQQSSRRRANLLHQLSTDIVQLETWNNRLLEISVICNASNEAEKDTTYSDSRSRGRTPGNKSRGQIDTPGRAQSSPPVAPHDIKTPARKGHVTFVTSTGITTMAEEKNAFEDQGEQRPMSTSSEDPDESHSEETRLVQQYLHVLNIMSNVFNSAESTAQASNDPLEVRGQKTIINNEWDSSYAPALKSMQENKDKLSGIYEKADMRHQEKDKGQTQSNVSR